MPRSPGHTIPYYLVNAVTLYRIVTVPVLLWLLFTGKYALFKWGLGASFFTDFIDGFLARKYKVTSVAGTRLDSVGDDLTVAVAVTGLLVQYPVFVRQQLLWLLILFSLFILQTAFACYRYHRMSNFHTWLAKLSALLQGIFLLLAFFTGHPSFLLFIIAWSFTCLELLEEIWLVYLLPEWRINIHSSWHVLHERNKGKAK